MVVRHYQLSRCLHHCQAVRLAWMNQRIREGTQADQLNELYTVFRVEADAPEMLLLPVGFVLCGEKRPDDVCHLAGSGYCLAFVSADYHLSFSDPPRECLSKRE